MANIISKIADFIRRKSPDLEGTYPEASEYRFYFKLRGRAGWKEFQDLRTSSYVAPEDIEDIDKFTGFHIKLEAWKDKRRLGICKGYPILVKGDPNPDIAEAIGFAKTAAEEYNDIKKRSGRLRREVEELIEAKRVIDSSLRLVSGGSDERNNNIKNIFEAYNYGLSQAIIRGLEKKDAEVGEVAVEILRGISGLIEAAPTIIISLINAYSTGHPRSKSTEEKAEVSASQDEITPTEDIIKVISKAAKPKTEDKKTRDKKEVQEEDIIVRGEDDGADASSIIVSDTTIDDSITSESNNNLGNRKEE